MTRNQIVNYFAIVSSFNNAVVRVIRSPITINSGIAKTLVTEQFKDIDKNLIKVLHVCFDVDSRIIYIPNASDFARDTLTGLLEAVKLRMSRDFSEGYALRTPIEGSPFSSLRYRFVESFQQVYETINRQFKDTGFDNLPVIEANLSRMSFTTQSLPDRYKSNKEFIGGYISTSDCGSISFLEEFDMYGRKREKPILLLTQKTPFILIDISQTPKRSTPTAMDKEIVVLNGYRDHLYSQGAKDEDSFADLYSIKRHLYMGWPFEEVCSLMLRDKINNFGELMNAISLLTKSADSLEADGYSNPADNPYYIAFNIDDSFPLRLSSMMNNGKTDLQKQYGNFVVLDYDNKKSSVIIASPVFISPIICSKVLNAKSNPFICKYNPIGNTIDVKSGRAEKYQLVKINNMIGRRLNNDKSKDLVFKNDEMACGLNAVNSGVYTVRKISDYYYACDFVKALCKSMDMEFKDIEVVVGPIENVMGRGTNGGFMGERAFRDNKVKLPLKLDKNISIMPPVIIINSVTYPSYASQTEILIHEYAHYLFEINNFAYENLYNKEKDKGYKYWFLYFTDPSERVAHINQIKFEFLIGKSYDEIIRNKVGGEITESNYPIAIKFSELVTEARKQMEV